MPETDDPQPKQSAKTIVSLAPADLTDGEYHQLANEYLDTVVAKFEELQDEKDAVDVEFTVRKPLLFPMGPVQPLGF